MGRLILIRHGETAKNGSNQLHGVGDTETLNELGRQQIAKTGIRLSKYSPSKVFSSKERRALQSAELIANLRNVPVEPIDGMQKRNWGVFTGRPWSEVRAILDPMTLDERYHYIPRDGESWEVFEARLINAITKLVTSYRDITIVVVTHGGAIWALMPFLLGAPKEASFNYDPDNASMTILDFDGSAFSEVVVNDTAHL